MAEQNALEPVELRIARAQSGASNLLWIMRKAKRLCFEPGHGRGAAPELLERLREPGAAQPRHEKGSPGAVCLLFGYCFA